MSEKENTGYELKIAENRRSPQLFDIFLEEALSKFFENIAVVQRNTLVGDIKKHILSFFSPENPIEEISSLKIIDDYLIISGRKETIFYIGNGKVVELKVSSIELITKIQEHKKETSQTIEKVEKYIDALDSIFLSKKGEWFGNLGEQDTVKGDEFGSDLKGKNPLQIQKEIDKLLGLLAKASIKDQKMLGYVQKSKERYFKMLMGIGDIYERGADFFPKKKEKIVEIGTAIVQNKNIPECFDFLYQIHKEMYDNTYQSSQVKQSYKSVAEILHTSIFQKLVEKNASDEDFLHLAKLVSGRSGKVVNTKTDDGMGGEIEVQTTEAYISSELLDSKLSNKIIMHLFTRKGGVIDRMDTSKKFQVVDEKASKESPNTIVSKSKEVLETYIIKQNGIDSEAYLKSMGCESVLGIKKGIPYENLNLEQKSALSLLVRFNEKVVQKAHPVNNAPYGEFGNISIGSESQATQAVDIQEILAEVRQEAFTAVSESIAKNTQSGFLSRTTKSAEELGFTGTDAKIYDLFVDIQGNGLFNLSDESIEWNRAATKTIGGLGVILGTAIVAGCFLPVTVVGGIVIGVTASVASIGTEFVINGKGFETPTEAIVDMGSDVVVGGVTGGLGGKVLQSGVTKVFRSEISGKWIFGIEIVGLGFIPEMGRQWAVDEAFRRKSIFTAH